MSAQKILVIDDDETILAFVTKILNDNNFAPTCVTNGAEGLKSAQNDNFAAIILDIMMPNMDGEEVIKQLQSNDKTKNTPIMMLTGKNEISEVAKFFEYGAKDYMVKPFDSENLIIRLQKVIQN